MRRQAIAFLVESLRLYRLRTAVTLLVLLGATLLEGIGVGLLVPVLQSLEGIGGAETALTSWTRSIFDALGIVYSFAALVTILGAALLLRYALEAAYQHLARVLGSTVTRELRERAFNSLIQSPLSFFYAQRTGDLVSTLHISALNAGGTVELFLQVAVSTLFIIVYLSLSLALSVPLTLGVLGFACLAYFLILPRFKIGFTHGREEKDSTDRIASFLVDTLSGIKTVKTFHGEPRHMDAFGRLSRDFQRLSVRIQDNRIFAELSLEPLIMIVGLALVIASVSLLQVPAAYLLTFLYIVFRTIPRVRAANAQILEIFNYLPHALRVKALVEGHDRAGIDTGVREFATLREAVTFHAVTFRYPGTERPALKDISLRFEKNCMTALIGASGGGKTTLVNLLLRHHEPHGGTICADGIELKDIRLDDWRRLVALVEQDAHLFNLTVFENIAYGRPGCSEGDVTRAARLAHADEFIGELPEGYETRVGERGMKLSGGQRQRIALARALIRDPEILVLDEATSSLDAESEHLIQQSIEELARTKTLIVVTHRLSTIAKADWLYVLEGGVVAEEGRPLELLREGGIYQKYRSLQLLDDIAPGQSVWYKK